MADEELPTIQEEQVEQIQQEDKVGGEVQNVDQIDDTTIKEEPIKQDDTIAEEVQVDLTNQENKVDNESQVNIDTAPQEDQIQQTDKAEVQEKQIEVKEEPIEIIEEPIEGNEEPIEIQEEPIEGKEKPLEIKKEPIEGKEDLIGIKDEPIEGKEEPIEIQEEQQTPQDGEVSKIEENLLEVKPGENTEQTQQDDKISIIDEEIQKIMDLDQAPSIRENISDLDVGIIRFIEEEEENEQQKSSEVDLQSLQVDIDDEEFQTAIFDLGDIYPFTVPDGLITPPPTPEIAGDGSQMDLKSSGRDTTSEIQGDSELGTDRGSYKGRKIPKTKQTKRAGFKMGSINEIPSFDAGSDYGIVNKVITGVKDREELKQQAECNRFAGFEKFASHFVDKIIDKSVNSVIDHKMYTTQFGAEDASTLSSYQTFVEVFGTFTKWPRIQEFSKEIGENVINEFIQTWEYNEEWMFCIDFLLEQSDECSEFYLYEVKWSIPSKPYPIPQATASIYFTIEVSRVKPPFCPVDVTYVFEGSRMVHTPGKIPFQEDMLFNIIDAKLEMYKQIKF